MLKQIQDNLKNQNGRCTSDPIFIVYDWDKLPTTADYAEAWEYADTYEGYTTIGTTKEELLKYANDHELTLLDKEKIEEMDGDELLEFLDNDYESYIKNYYFKRRVFKGVFFTEKAADKFIAQNKHHLSDEVHTYVESLYRNPEMKYVRECLLNGKFNIESGEKQLVK